MEYSGTVVNVDFVEVERPKLSEVDQLKVDLTAAKAKIEELTDENNGVRWGSVVLIPSWNAKGYGKQIYFWFFHILSMKVKFAPDVQPIIPKRSFLSVGRRSLQLQEYCSCSVAIPRMLPKIDNDVLTPTLLVQSNPVASWKL